MKKYLLCAATIVMAAIMAACSDSETYADKLEKENAAISQFVSGKGQCAATLLGRPITVISEHDFEAAGNRTDAARNEFVLFENTGIYMQIVRRGCGKPIASGETATVLCRFNEYNLLTDSLQLTNNGIVFQHIPDKMYVTNSYGTFTGSFDSNSSIMSSAYGSTSVPGGWLIPLRYINVGRQSTPDEEIAKVNVIVPSAQGQQYASANTYPCYYELTYERGL